MVASSSKSPLASPPMPEYTYDQGSASTSSSFLSPVTPQMQSPLLRAPSEIIQKVLSASGGDEVYAIAQAAKTCKELRSIIYDNPDQALWRQVHLQHYDDPRTAAAFPTSRASSSVDWRQQVQDREFVARIFRDWDEDQYGQLDKHADLICTTLMEMYLEITPATPSHDPRTSDDSPNCTLLSSWLRSALFKYIYESQYFTEPEPTTSYQLRSSPKRVKKNPVDPIMSRLHCLVPPEYDDDLREDREWRGFARRTVYNAKNFREENDYGPFTGDGKVNWELVDAISSVMMCNAQEVIKNEPTAWLPAVQPMSYGVESVRGWGYTELKRPDNLAEGDVWDWAGVEGNWCGCYAFMDYVDWVALNYPQSAFLHRLSSEIDLSLYHEALGDLMQLELKICTDPHTSNPRDNRCTSHEFENDRTPLPSVDTDLPSSDLLPPIYFHGSSVPYAGGDAPPLPQNAIRGVARLTADNPPQVRWTMIIRYRDSDRWRLECVQVGGRGSKRGFFGIWSDATRGEQSPCGPAWYWKT
ncbi:hypothetical protein I302_101574 [Kwoniella bestiolae CBS 10118]|uniref:F-box domain-containing protein n=1 Tax=Kwoniella bestiolae CBS 10118 TaxID=1296100 RepID=A0A1B9GCN2_9TREE|nr:hypothetical protein I302_00257 [Kwoniella bestiolae CBS 10118]OCF28768.1 hypothetical protein I302_00257 [Kwoniella bestiolae CBS 10118]